MNYVWGAVALALLALGYHFGGLEAEKDLLAYKGRAEAAIAQASRQETAASEHAREVEKATQGRVERLAQAYEVDKHNAQESADRVIGDLSNRVVRLRQQWQGAEATDRLADSATATRHADELAQLRAQGARDLVRVGAEADAQVRGLQAYADSVSGR